MKRFKRILVTLAIVAVIIALVFTIDHFFGTIWANSVLLILLLLSLAVSMGFNLHPAPRIKVEKKELSCNEICATMAIFGSKIDNDYIVKMREHTEPTDNPSTKQRALLGELSTLEKNLRKYIAMAKNDANLSDDERLVMYEQIGEMVFYHKTLVIRCVDNDALLRRDDSSQESDSSSSVQEDSSSSGL